MLRRSLKRKTEQTEPVVGSEGKSRNQSLHKPKKKVLGLNDEEDRVEQVLRGIVFGDNDDLIDKLVDTSKQKKNTKKFPPLEEERKPAWEDEDDETNISLTDVGRSTVLKSGESISGKTYIDRLQGRFKKVVSTPDWAQPGYTRSNSADEDSDVEDVLHRTGDYLTKFSNLQNGHIQIKQCTNANRECPTKGKLTSVEFHPTAQVILTAGMDQTLNLFQVDGKTNPKIQGVFLDKFPISTAHFSDGGKEVILGSWLRMFYCYDMIAGKVINIPKIKGLEGDSMAEFKVSPDGQFLIFLGKFGCIHILSAKSKEWIQTLKMNGNVMSIAFSSDGSKMYSFGDEGCVYVWDMKTRDCVHKFYDDGCFRGTTVAVSPNNQYISCGSFSGIVNIYDSARCVSENHPKPERSVGNLTTSVRCSGFNSSSEILGLASDAELALKLVHLPSCKVFSNFPDQAIHKIRVPKCLDFSLNSGYLAVGNNKGHALLFRLKHYGNY